MQMNDMQKLGNELYNFLKTKDYFKESPHLNPKVEWLIKDRERCQLYSNMRILSFLNPPYDTFLNLCKQFDDDGTFEKELPIMKYTLITNIILFQCESLKRIFNIALDFKKINLKRKHPTYGQIIDKLKDNGLEDNIVGVMNNKLRNIIAHEDWYVENDQLVYMDNGEHMISYDELLQSRGNFTDFGNTFYPIYWKNHSSPEIIEFCK